MSKARNRNLPTSLRARLLFWIVPRLAVFSALGALFYHLACFGVIYYWEVVLLFIGLVGYLVVEWRRGLDAQVRLKASIGKWILIRERLHKENGAWDCPLCHRYINVFCRGCPIRKYTGYAWCEQTPYGDMLSTAAAYRGGRHWDGFIRRYADKEVKLLDKILFETYGSVASELECIDIFTRWRAKYLFQKHKTQLEMIR